MRETSHPPSLDGKLLSTKAPVYDEAAFAESSCEEVRQSGRPKSEKKASSHLLLPLGKKKKKIGAKEGCLCSSSKGWSFDEILNLVFLKPV
jgi:hypothetical protein